MYCKCTHPTDYDSPSASLAKPIDWTVCFITPSSAATTSTTMSVTIAPRALIAENAAWPGVSRNVITSPPDSCTTQQSVNPSIKLVNQATHQAIQSIHRHRWMDLLINQSINKTMNEWINKSINQSRSNRSHSHQCSTNLEKKTN